ncbi:hypothetical protein [Polyangium aurulentum]|uniref:hypothetical protein n=1 Tax=Polyangium aurulentum TaxID=2567896 RepID=UPI0010AE57AF|nr:hypothetical protein [Polyangium aurulentum]UQA57777.1 hypothetical protein E8A73_041950 [Polyangium aurulentum]
MSNRWSTRAAEVIDAWDLEPKSGIRLRCESGASPCPYRMDAEADALLREDPALVPLLDETCQRLSELFGPDATFVLERFEDAESPEEAPRLFLVVHTGMDPDEAHETLKRFYRDFWIDASAGAVGKLEITVELI